MESLSIQVLSDMERQFRMVEAGMELKRPHSTDAVCDLSLGNFAPPRRPLYARSSST